MAPRKSRQDAPCKCLTTRYVTVVLRTSKAEKLRTTDATVANIITHLLNVDRTVVARRLHEGQMGECTEYKADKDCGHQGKSRLHVGNLAGKQSILLQSEHVMRP
jgi:hypothetical protein